MNSVNILSRRFAIAKVEIDHGFLLLRSEGIDDQDNINVRFSNVVYLDLPWVLHGFVTSPSTSEEISYAQKRYGYQHNDGLELTVLLSRGQRYFVLSSGYAISYDKNLLFEYSF
jgi:hypothetical protein